MALWLLKMGKWWLNKKHRSRLSGNLTAKGGLASAPGAPGASLRELNGLGCLSMKHVHHLAPSDEELDVNNVDDSDDRD